MTRQPLIGNRDRSELKRSFRKDLKDDVTLRLFTQRPSPLTIPGRECRYCPQTQQLMEELSALSPKLHLETVDFYEQSQSVKEQGVERIPAILQDAGGSTRVKFYGTPKGYEMVIIIEDIKTISRGISRLTMRTRKNLRRVNQPVHIQVFVTPSCTLSPALAQLAHAFALDSPHIAADVVEIQEFPALAQAYGVRSVPLTIINEYTRIAGAVTEGELLEKVLEAGVRPTAEKGGASTRPT